MSRVIRFKTLSTKIYFEKNHDMVLKGASIKKYMHGKCALCALQQLQQPADEYTTSSIQET
jgi:hypothetical protein